MTDNFTKVKICHICKSIFVKPPKYGYKLWNLQRCCSRSCSTKLDWLEGKFGEERNKKVSISKMGSKNPAWVGNKVKYNPLHQWVRKYKTPRIKCEFCGLKKILELSNKSGKYLRELSDWQWLCKSCHSKYDFTEVTRKKLSFIALTRSRDSKGRWLET